MATVYMYVQRSLVAMNGDPTNMVLLGFTRF